MNDEVVGDNGNAAAEDGSNNGSPEQGTEHKLLFGKFKTEAEAEKGYKELEHKLGEQGNELGTLKRQIEDLGEKKQFVSVLQSLVEQGKPKEQQVSPEQFENELAEAFREDPKLGVQKMLRAMGSWNAEVEQKTKAESQKLMSQLASEINSLKSVIVKSDPEYLKHKAVIDEMVANGMPLEAAKAIANKYVASANTATRETPPAGINGQRIIASEQGAIFSKEEKDHMIKEGLTVDDIKALEIKYKNRKSADRTRAETWS